MYKLIILTMVITSILLVCISCIGPGISDWRYEIRSNYVLSRTSSYRVVLIRNIDTDNSKILIDDHITEFSYNEQYIAVKRRTYIEGEVNPEGKPQIKHENYILLDTSTGGIIEFDSIQDLELKILEMEVYNMSSWISTKMKPGT